MNLHMSKPLIGLIGLGVMGENLALNLIRHGHSVVGYDADAKRRDAFKQCTGESARVAASLSAVLSVLPAPRLIWLMVPAGATIDAILLQLQDRLSPGDVVMDGGNSHYEDTERRVKSLHAKGIHYLGLGVSGGQEGALKGPAMMPGGDPKAWDLVNTWLPDIAAHTPQGQSCCQWMGKGGAGHFVKMVHNGIEYADMQLLAESHALMERLLGFKAKAMSQAMQAWQSGWMDSYLLDITVDILRRDDAESGQALVDLILDKAEQKGTGRWTSEAALAFGVPTPTLTAAVFARITSAHKAQRLDLSKHLQGAAQPATCPPQAQTLSTLADALLAARILAFAQGFHLMRTASQERQWHIPLHTVAEVWQAGCILRGELLKPIASALARSPEALLLTDPQILQALNERMGALRQVVQWAVASDVAVPCFMSALDHWNGMRTAVSSARLIQAQRDYFGAHTYERVDRPGHFHTQWSAG